MMDNSGAGQLSEFSSASVSSPADATGIPAAEILEQPVEEVVDDDPRILTLVVGGQEFRVAKAFLSIHSVLWAERIKADPTTTRVEFKGVDEQDRSPEEVADDFGRFLSFLGGGEEDGTDSEVTEKNCGFLLRWAAEFDVDYLYSLVESFLMSNVDRMDPLVLLELAARHDLPLLYSRCCERAAQGFGHVDVDLLSAHSSVFGSAHIRDDLVTSQVCMDSMRRDAEARRRIRFADYTAQIPTQGRQRARVLWRNRCKLTNQARGATARPRIGSRLRSAEPAAAPEPPKSYALGEWRISPSVVWPHDSLRDHTWPTVPGETQPLC